MNPRLREVEAQFRTATNAKTLQTMYRKASLRLHPNKREDKNQATKDFQEFQDMYERHRRRMIGTTPRRNPPSPRPRTPTGSIRYTFAFTAWGRQGRYTSRINAFVVSASMDAGVSVRQFAEWLKAHADTFDARYAREGYDVRLDDLSDIAIGSGDGRTHWIDTVLDQPLYRYSRLAEEGGRLVYIFTPKKPRAPKKPTEPKKPRAPKKPTEPKKPRASKKPTEPKKPRSPKPASGLCKQDCAAIGKVCNSATKRCRKPDGPSKTGPSKPGPSKPAKSARSSTKPAGPSARNTNTGQKTESGHTIWRGPRGGVFYMKGGKKVHMRK